MLLYGMYAFVVNLISFLLVFGWVLEWQGEDGVRHILKLLKDELQMALMLAGCTKVRRAVKNGPDRMGLITPVLT